MGTYNSKMQNIWLHFGFGENRKNKILKRKLGYKGLWCFTMLLLYTGRSRPNGMLDNLSKEEIALESGWLTDNDYDIKTDTEIEEHIDKYIDALIDSKWMKLDKRKNEYSISSFADNNPHLDPVAALKRREQAADAVKERWKKHARESSGYEKQDIEAINEEDARKKYNGGGKYPIDFASLPYPLILNGNVFDDQEFRDLYIDHCKHDPQHRALIYSAIKDIRECKCRAKFINNDKTIKQCYQCQGGK